MAESSALGQRAGKKDQDVGTECDFRAGKSGTSGRSRQRLDSRELRLQSRGRDPRGPENEADRWTIHDIRHQTREKTKARPFSLARCFLGAAFHNSTLVKCFRQSSVTGAVLAA